jgi:hypothetical protein
VEYPDRYRDISHALTEASRVMASESGGFSVSLEHLGRTKASRQLVQQLQGKIKTILDDDTLTDAQRHECLIKTVGSAMESLGQLTLEGGDCRI